ncbi:hypothetical protein GF406_05235 [candidate division KSB1 bacterium]|nr:hypothetical protein [candidate division KSB1 bacterium]
MSENTIHSYHAFLFPFRWEKDGKIDLNEFKTELENVGWKYEPFTIKTARDYNEFIYFYEYAREAIYNTNKIFTPNQTTYHFNYDIKNGKYIIKIKKQEKPYELNIEEISIKVYETGIAILSFQMENRNYPEIKDIKKINDFGRRTYPQYLPLDAVQESFLAESIEITGAPLELKETFKDYINLDFDITSYQNPARLPRFIKNLLGENFSDNIIKNKIFVDPVVDDRMFTLCWYGDDKTAEHLTKFDTEKQCYAYETDPLWHELIFIDNDTATCESKIMLPKLLRERTYDRWIDQGTLFGISRYSFILITKRGWFPENILLNHFKTMYYQMVVLALAQRASILDFSKRITRISKVKSLFSDKVPSLFQDYLRFVNKMCLTEVTAQEQGIEMYDMMLTCMKIKENNKNIEGEIKTLHNTADLIEEKRTAKAINKITIIGLYLLLPSLVIGFLGMSVFSKSFLCLHIDKWWLWAGYILISFPVAGFIHWLIRPKKEERK